jgi:hypothetical protein
MELDIDREDYKWIGAIAVAILLLIVAALMLLGGPDEPETTPPDGVEGTQTRDGGVNIDKGEYTEDGIYEVIYKGEPSWNRTGRRISTVPEIDPVDEYLNVYITGYITEVNGSDLFRAEIYTDQSFRDTVQPLNVAWGPTMEHFRSYQPEEVRDGVYKDTITDTNVSRFKDAGPHSDGGVNVAIGNFTHGGRDKPRSKYTVVYLQ